MILENVDRNNLIYELWKKGLTIDEISFDTSIPRSTVGYYIRKFNKCAKSGKPIAFQQIKEQLDEKAMAIQGFVKSYSYSGLLKMLSDGEMDKVYKILMILKLLKELNRDIFPTKEEGEAFIKNFGYIVEQIALARASDNKLKSN